MLNRAEELRLVADYKGDLVDPDDAAWAVDEAGRFVELMKETFLPELPGESAKGSPESPGS